MAWSGYQLFLAGLLVVTGSINTIATKWADMATTSGSPYGHMRGGNSTSYPHKFSHPFVQSLGMFFGEFTCLLTFKLLWLLYSRQSQPFGVDRAPPSALDGNRDFNPLIFLPPALCDMVGTTVMYIGLNLTYASSAQMLRGAVIIFTGIFSTIFLKRRLRAFQWIGIVTVLTGLAIVGSADMFFGKKGASADSPSTSSIVTGDLLIVAAQVITATQMVLEEKFVVGSNVPPLQAVGWEGLFGMTAIALLLIPLYFIQWNGAPIEDIVDALYQMKNSYQALGGFLGTVVSISFFNFAGVSVTKELSATTRMVLDSVRTITVWAASLALLGDQFIPLTLLGFAILITGMMLYNNIIIVPFLVRIGCMQDPLSDNASIDEQEEGLVRDD